MLNVCIDNSLDRQTYNTIITVSGGGEMGGRGRGLSHLIFPNVLLYYIHNTNLGEADVS